MLKATLQRWLGIEQLIQERDDACAWKQRSMLEHKQMMDDCMCINRDPSANHSIATLPQVLEEAKIQVPKDIFQQPAQAQATQPNAFNPSLWTPAMQYIYTPVYGPDYFNIYRLDRTQLPYFFAVDNTSVRDNDVYRPIYVGGYVPPGTLAVYISGFLIQTHGNSPETSNLGVFFRQNSAAPVYNYISQSVAATGTAGIRSGCSTWVTINPNTMTFDFMWSALAPSGPVYSYPNFTAYGANMRITAAAVWQH